MKAVGYQIPLPSQDPLSLQDIEWPEPVAIGRDLLIEVKAIAVNPVDCKVRTNRRPPPDQWQILGWDACGVVRAVGPEVKTFQPGDRVWYAGDVTRPGSNAEYQAVDERIVGRMPNRLGFAEAAALPLTAITAWEILFDCFGLREGEDRDESLLIVGGAGGVGSILIQLAKKLTALRILATASRPETRDWVQKMGADLVIDHRQPLDSQCKDLGIQPRYVAALTGTDGHFPALINLAKPRGHVAVIDDPKTLDIKPGKSKSLTFSWEYMFARSLHQMPDMEKQRELLNRVADLIDQGLLMTTVTRNLGKINAENLRAAHQMQEGGMVIGKQVLEGW